MLRAVDLRLLALAVAVAGIVGSVAARRSGVRRVGVVAVLGALLLARLGDRWFVHAVPDDLTGGLERSAQAAIAALALAVGWGASRLPVSPTAGLPAVLPLALASLVGVWAGVPETSAALLAAGVLLGLTAVLLARRLVMTPWAAIVVSVTPVAAAAIGAVGEAHAVVGGLLCSATFVALGVGRAIRLVPVDALAMGTALHLVAALVAARQVAIVRDWSGSLLPIVVVVGLSVAAAAALRRGQGRPPA